MPDLGIDSRLLRKFWDLGTAVTVKAVVCNLSMMNKFREKDMAARW